MAPRPPPRRPRHWLRRAGRPCLFEESPGCLARGPRFIHAKRRRFRARTDPRRAPCLGFPQPALISHGEVDALTAFLHRVGDYSRRFTRRRRQTMGQRTYSVGHDRKPSCRLTRPGGLDRRMTCEDVGRKGNPSMVLIILEISPEDFGIASTVDCMSSISAAPAAAATRACIATASPFRHYPHSVWSCLKVPPATR